MTILPVVAIAFGAGAASLLARRSPGWSAAFALVGLAGMAVVSATLPPDTSLAIGGESIVGTAYVRLFAILGSVVGLLLAALGLLTVSHHHAPGVLLAGLGAGILALALPDPRLAILAATVGGLIGILVTVVHEATAREAVVAARELRAVVVAGALAILATAWIGRPLGELAVEPAVFGLAYLGFALAVAIRAGAIPFHFWAARLADATPEVAMPLLMAWGPATFAAVALAWADQSIAPLALPLGLEQTAVATIGGLTVVLGVLAAWIQDDLEHVVGYTIIADAGIVLLGLAALDPAAWEPARTWLLVFVMSRSAFAAWALAVRGAFGTRRIPELRGWARRAPLLALGLLIVAAASIGWPGLAVWEARAELIALGIGGPVGLVVLVGAVAGLAVYGRLLVLGLGRPSAAVAGAASERPAWPAPLPSRPMVGLGGVERGFEHASHALSGTLDVIWTVPAAIRLNRSPIAALIVVVLAGLAFVVAAGGLGGPAAARAVPGQIVEPGPSEPAPTEPAPSFRPSPEPTRTPVEPTEPPPSGPSFQPVPT